MVARHRCDPVRSSLRATDAAVPVVVPRGDRLGSANHGRGRDLTTCERDQLRRGAARQHLVQRGRLAPVDGQTVVLPDIDHPRLEPAAVLPRQPHGCVAVDLLVAVHARTRQRQVQQVGREPATGSRIRSAQPAVVCLGTSHHVLDCPCRTCSVGHRPLRRFLTTTTRLTDTTASCLAAAAKTGWAADEEEPHPRGSRVQSGSACADEFTASTAANRDDTQRPRDRFGKPRRR